MSSRASRVTPRGRRGPPGRPMAKSRRRRLPIPVPSFVEGVLDSSLDRAMRVQRPGVVSYVERARAKRGLSPADTIRELEKLYLGTVATIGAVAGDRKSVV